MENLQNTMSFAFELIVTISVAALVWFTVIAGLVQLVREQIRHFQFFARASGPASVIQRIDTGPQVAHHPPAAMR